MICLLLGGVWLILAYDRQYPMQLEKYYSLESLLQPQFCSAGHRPFIVQFLNST